MLKPVGFKSVIAATAFLALAGSSYVYAQQGWGGHRGYGDGPRFEHRHRSPADIAAFTDARIAALKAGLELTPDQVKNWPPFEQAVRDMVQLRIQRMQARQAGDQQPTSPFDRMSKRADNMSKASAALKKVADAGAPLYASLNDDQKARFGELSRMLRPHHHHMRGDNERNGGWRQGRGDGQGDGRGFGGDGHGWRHGSFGQEGGGRGRMQSLMGQSGDQDSQL
jgi:zinc resistance-associated protein